MTDETKRIILSVAGSILEGAEDLEDLEGEVVLIPARKSCWEVQRGGWIYRFTPSGDDLNGLDKYRLFDQRAR